LLPRSFITLVSHALSLSISRNKFASHLRLHHICNGFELGFTSIPDCMWMHVECPSHLSNLGAPTRKKIGVGGGRGGAIYIFIYLYMHVHFGRSSFDRGTSLPVSALKTICCQFSYLVWWGKIIVFRVGWNHAQLESWLVLWEFFGAVIRIEEEKLFLFFKN
jgi:hypothetical protein